MRKREIILIESTINLKSVLEPRTAAQLVQLASKYGSRISLRLGEKTANAKSIMGIISMQLTDGSSVTVTADGPDKEAAVKELGDFLSGDVSQG